MGKKSIISKIKAKLTLKTYQKPLFVTVVILLIINFGILLLSSLIGVLIDTKKAYFGGSFFKAFAASLTWMITPNSITKYSADTDLRIMILAATVIAIEMVLFSGAIVATLTTALRTIIDKKSKAKGAIAIDGHFVILNWNTKVPDMVYNLLVKGYKGNILILSNKNKEYIEGEIQSVISSFEQSGKKKIRLIVKEGNPLLHGDLSDISIDKASNICIMAREDMAPGDDPNILNSDLFSLKIMLSLGNFDISRDCNVVVETDSDSVRHQISKLAHTVESLKDKTIIPVSFNKKIGQIIAQTIINPNMANLYLELFSFEGSEFYSCDSKYEVEEFLINHNSAIPIIKLGKMFVLADDLPYINKKRETAKSYAKKLNVNEKKNDEKFTVFVIGENKKSKHIIENLELTSHLMGDRFGLVTFKKNEIKALIKEINSTDGLKKVLILSDDSVGQDSYDANVFVTLIELQNAFPSRDNLSFITELLDSRNLQSVKDFNIRNAIISNRMMSLLITNLALNDYSKRFFDNLLRIDTEADGECFDIATKRVSELFDDDKLVFESKSELIHSVYYSFEKKYMPLGYIKNDKITFVCDNQDLKEAIELNSDDELIYIVY